MDADNVGVAVGGRFLIARGLYVAASYTHLQYMNRTVTGSQLSEVNGTPVQLPTQQEDGNGQYTQWIGIFRHQRRKVLLILIPPPVPRPRFAWTFGGARALAVGPRRLVSGTLSRALGGRSPARKQGRPPREGAPRQGFAERRGRAARSSQSPRSSAGGRRPWRLAPQPSSLRPVRPPRLPFRRGCPADREAEPPRSSRRRTRRASFVSLREDLPVQVLGQATHGRGPLQPREPALDRIFATRVPKHAPSGAAEAEGGTRLASSSSRPDLGRLEGDKAMAAAFRE